MGQHYTIESGLQALYEPSYRYYIGLAIIMVCFYLYYWNGIRQGFKHKTAGMPWQVNMYNFANDMIYVVPGFSLWWGKNSPNANFMTKFLWVGLVIWFIMEFIVHYQSIKWDLDHIFPSIKNRTHQILAYIGVQLVFIAGYGFLWNCMDDPFVWIMFGTTVPNCLNFYFRMMHVNGSTRGIHKTTPWGLLFANFACFFLWLPAAGPAMSNFYTYFLGVCEVGVAIAFIILYNKTPKYVAPDKEVTPEVLEDATSEE